MAWQNNRFTDSASSGMAARAAVAAQLIAPNSAVADIGCGHMHVRKFLPASVRYSGFDLEPVVDGVARLNLDARQFPEGRWDYILLLGVLPWITERQWTLESARLSATRLVVSRSDDRFDAMIDAAGWALDRALPFQSRKGPAEIRLYR